MSETISGADLVKEFNALAESDEGKALGTKPVKRFTNNAIGTRRLELLKAAIAERNSAPVHLYVGPAGEPLPTLGIAACGAKDVPRERLTNVESGIQCPLCIAWLAKHPVEAPAVAEPTTEEEEVKPTKKAETVLEKFEAREGSVRAKVLTVLANNLNKNLPMKELLKAAYGRVDPDNRGALMMSLRGAMDTIVRKKLAFKIEKGKNDDGEMVLGLHAK